MRQDSLISYGDLERLGWPQYLIDDYLGRLRELTPQRDVEPDPNGIFEANLNGLYIDTNLNVIWFNPSPGANTGWIQVS